MLQKTEFQTRDRDEAVAAMSGMVSSQLALEGRGPVDVRLSVTVSDVVTDAMLGVGAEFRAVNTPVDFVHIVTTGGLYFFDAGGVEHVASLGETVRPPTHVACRFVVPRGDFRVTTIPGSAVRDVAREVFVDQPATLRPDAIRPMSPGLERLWLSAIALYRDHILQPDIYENDLIRREATRSLISTAILAFGLHTPAERTAAPSLAARRARTYIDDHLQQPVTIHDVAAASRLSVRGLQYAFHAAYGVAPMAYLRSARLSAARQDLLAGDPTKGDSVAQIARRWGFLHLGRFAGAYRDEYGESPSTTLAR